MEERGERNLLETSPESMRLRDYVVIFFLIVLFGLSATLRCYAVPAESGIPAEQIVMHGVGIDSDQQCTVWRFQ